MKIALPFLRSPLGTRLSGWLLAASALIVAALIAAAQPAAAQNAYITNLNDNTVSVIATASNTVTATIAVGNGPEGVAVTPDGSTVYVANLGTVSVISTANNTVGATIAVGGEPGGVAVTPDGSTVYVANVTLSGTVWVISTATNTVTATIAVGNHPYGVAVTPDGSTVYVTNEGDAGIESSVSVIATASNTVTHTMTVGNNPHGVAVTPGGSTVYVANQLDNTVSVIATASNTVATTIAVGRSPFGVAVTPDGSTVYVANHLDNTVSVIATASNTVAATIAVGSFPEGVAVTPDGSTVYVANEGDNTVSVIPTASNAVAATIAVGSEPFAFGAFIGPSPPAVGLISPSSGPASGGTRVTITGDRFTGTTAVEFGGTLALFELNSRNSITAIAPAGSGTVDVMVTTPAGTSATSADDLFTYIAPVTLTLAATASSTTQVGQTYSQTNVAGGGTSPYTYLLSAGVLPAGTTLNTSNGTVSGTPSAAGTFAYTIEVTDSESPAQTATRTLSGTIAPATLTLASTASSNTAVGQFYRQLNTASGGTIPYTYSLSAGTLPGGTTLKTTTGTVYGTPTTGGAFSYTIEATDSGNPTPQTATQVVSGTIAPIPTAPTVSAVSPNGGPPAGGSTVMITGTNLTGATAVNFGASAARQFAVNSATEISAVSPAGAVGSVDVRVTTGNGTSVVSAADRFSYAAARSTQRGQKLVGSGYSGAAEEAFALALTPDGSTAVLGGFADNADVGAAWIFSHSSGAWTQVGGKLFGSGATGNAEQGYAVAISGDGNTMLVGGPADNGNAGAVWVFVQSGGAWTQQGVKLAPSDEAGAGQFGMAVALSNDGNTALIGGSADNAGVGAAWVFTRSGNAWTQQTLKLTARDESGAGGFGGAVALSSAATTALIGGSGDLANTGGPSLTPLGAAWIFTQSGNVWSQDGSKLVGSGSVGAAMEGFAVSLSADGNTALIGGPADNSGTGAGWVFTQSNSTWSQTGAKLVGTGAAGAAQQGFAVALSADASTVALGGDEDDSFNGAAWVFTQNGGAWTQHGAKLVGSGAAGAAQQGMALALSSNGQTLIEGGPFDSSGTGAAWVSTLGTLAASHDFNGDGMSDILWNDGSGDLAMWLMSGGQESSGAELANVGTSWSIVGTRDFNGDGYADILWLDGSGDLGLWLMNGASVASYASLGNVGTQWAVAGTGDFNGDGAGDILWRNSSTGDVAIWLMRNGAFSSGVDLGVVPLNWSVAGAGDFNGDGTTDILWRNTASGSLAIWLMSGGQVSSSLNVGSVPTDWTVVGTGDFNGDGVSDILWRDSAGDLAIWLMNSNGQMASGTTFSGIPATWSVAETGDFDGDGKSDILWLDQSGDLGVWLMNGLSVSSALGLGNVGTSWAVQGRNAD